jgi:GxxExxY protein
MIIVGKLREKWVGREWRDDALARQASHRSGQSADLPYRRKLLYCRDAETQRASRRMRVRDLNELSGTIVDAAIRVHSTLGPGLLESAYEACLAYELRERGLRVRTQLALPIVYKTIQLDLAYRIDLLIEESIVVELKTVSKLLPIHEAQLLTYLKLSGHRLGLLLNFHVPLMREGIKRMVNNL